MPFGLTNAPAIFERLMERVLRLVRGLQLEICLVYLDGIILFAATFDVALDNLEVVFEHLRDAGLPLIEGEEMWPYEEESHFPRPYCWCWGCSLWSSKSRCSVWLGVSHHCDGN